MLSGVGQSGMSTILTIMAKVENQWQTVRWTIETTVNLSKTGKEKAPKPAIIKSRWAPSQEGTLKISLGLATRVL
jgi:hypothetical protein